ncbi:multidrug ABC transporter permease [Photobacterium jeanii]|uniref:Multidrug ABC transporter permease n=1 Tax=Photobacterium jeanii TaxID=858640 RepID=A0A178K1N0_9GAMM|nr:ABC transporter permease [Photobacterium jeanii]OAN11239.1 multidrug ABC transporter permease [Photobacterium jeanii]PST90758.1 ABC transporter permease [Photobacterium jeanii]
MTLRSQLKREWQIWRSESWLKALTLWIPVLLFVVVWAIFSGGIARDLSIGVVDLDHSRISRQLTRYYDASPALAVTEQFASVEQGSTALRNGDIYALVVLPANLESDTLIGRAPEVTAFYNSQFILIGKLINSALLQAQGTFTAGVDTLKNMVGGSPVPLQALGQAVPVRSQITPLYNTNSHYGQFLVSAAIPAMWQILMVATTVLAMAAERRQRGVSQWLVNHPIRNLVAKMLPYTAMFWLQGIVFLVGMYQWLDWPMHGSWGILLSAQLLTVVACQGIGALIFLLTLDPTRAMSMVAGFTAPAFAFMGITFPASDMPLLAQIWRALLPISHYIEVQVMQVNYGSSLANTMPKMWGILAFWLVFLLVFKKAKQISQQQGLKQSEVNPVEQASEEVKA